DDLENDFILRINEEKKAMDKQLKLHERDCQEKQALCERILASKRDELEQRFARQVEENERSTADYKSELETTFQNRVEHIESDAAAKRVEYETRLQRREEQIKAREQILVEAENDWNARRNAFEGQWNEFESLRKEKENNFIERETSLVERTKMLNELEKQLHQREITQTSFDEQLKIREKHLAAESQKYTKLQEMEKEVMDAQAEVTRMREGLIRERYQLQQTIESERTRIRETQELSVKRLDEERNELTAQNKKVEQTRLSLERSREELSRMHRETLEIRLATEELWLRLAGDSAPEELKESLTRIRGRLAEQYNDAVRKLDIQKNELTSARQQVLEEHEKTVRRREELDKWAMQSERVLEEREDKIRDKELELERRQISVDDLVRRCRTERAELEKEVKLLQSQVEQFISTGTRAA
ncbi:MAG: hypothetical protein LBU65_10105, partial [Planctomycetaceae bacterium]|nr:hypothetical protein [Planctomycetaceae bacterium]